MLDTKEETCEQKHQSFSAFQMIDTMYMLLTLAITILISVGFFNGNLIIAWIVWMRRIYFIYRLKRAMDPIEERTYVRTSLEDDVFRFIEPRSKCYYLIYGHQGIGKAGDLFELD